MELPIKERYHQIKGYPEYYVTEHGDVYTYRNSKTGWQGIRKLALRGRNDPKRYLQVCLCRNGEKRYFQVHRLVAQYFCPGYFDGAVVDHKDRNIHNNYFSNLEWVTQKVNIHKSYQFCALGPTKNYSEFSLIFPNGKVIDGFIGRNQAIQYVKDHHLDVSPTSLIRWGVSRGYKLLQS